MDPIKKAAVARAQVWPREPEVSASWQWDIIMPTLKELQRSTTRTALIPKLLCTNIIVEGNRTDGPPNFTGPVSQGPPTGRFIYIDIGKSAGQFDCCQQRRIKIPLAGITWDLIDDLLVKPKRSLLAALPVPTQAELRQDSYPIR